MTTLLALALSTAAFADPTDLSKLTGTWNVTATQTPHDTCDDHPAGSVPSGSTASIWLVSTNNGKVSIDVQGSTRFPRLGGGPEGDVPLLLVGPGKASSLTMTLSGAPIVWYMLSPQPDGSLTGTERVLDFVHDPHGTLLPCFADWTVTAKR